MSQAVLPTIFYLLLQVPVFFVGMCVDAPKKILRGSDIMRVYIVGQLTVFAVIELLAVPMILLRWNFNILYYSVVFTVLLLAVFGGIRFYEGGSFRKNKMKSYSIPSIKGYIRSLSPLTIILFLIAFVLILRQVVYYYFGVHLDEDDARWLAEANDALAFGDMMTRNASTGEYIGNFAVVKDVSSPWPMFWAVLAKLLHTRASIFAHTLYPFIELVIMYMIYYLIGRELFEKMEARATFLLSTAVLCLYYAGTVYTQAVFSLVRIWQGKATVAAVIIPFLVYLFVRINKENETRDWLKLPIVCCGACLLSGMGVSIAAIMIGIYGLYHVVAYLDWRRIPLWILSVVPSVFISAVYFFFKE